MSNSWARLDQDLENLNEAVGDGKLRVSMISDYGDKIIVVLVPSGVVDRSVTVVDVTKPEEPKEPTLPEVAPSVPALPPLDVDSEGRIIASKDENGKPLTVHCRYCKQVNSARGCTRHENACSKNPANR